MNPYDQFDAPAPAANPYDQFDAPQGGEPGQIGAFGVYPSLSGTALGLFNAAKSAVNAPADTLSGALPTPYSGSIDAGPALDRARDFASLFGNEIVPGTPTAFTAPSASQLKFVANSQYNAARASGLELDPTAVSNMATGIQNDLTRKGFGGSVAPATHDILDKIANPAPLAAGENRLATIDDLMAMRENLGNVSGSDKDAKAGGIAKQGIEQYLGSLDPQDALAGTASPEAVAETLRDANDNWAAAMRANTISGDLSRGNTGFVERADAAAHASHSGLNFDNNLRQRVKSFLQSEDNLRGFSQPEIDALNAAVKGSLLQNTLRYSGNIMGGGGGIGGAIVGGLLGHIMHGDGESGMMLGLAGGRALKGAENALARRSLDNVDQMVRLNSPLGRALQNEGLLSQPSLIRGDALMRAIVPGLLAPLPPARLPSGLLGDWS